MTRPFVQKEEEKSWQNLTHFDAFINAFAYVYKYLINVLSPRDDDDDDAKNDDFFLIVGRIVREYEEQIKSFTTTKECA